MSGSEKCTYLDRISIDAHTATSQLAVAASVPVPTDDDWELELGCTAAVPDQAQSVLLARPEMTQHFDLQVCRLGGSGATMCIKAEDTVADLKAHIASTWDVPMSNQQLLLEATVLQPDSRQLRDWLHYVAQPIKITLVVRRRRCALFAKDKTMLLWDLDDDKQMLALHGHKKTVLSLTVDWSRARALSGSMDNTLRVWDLTSAKSLHVLDGAHSKGVRLVCADWSSSRALSVDHRGLICTWDLDAAVKVQVVRDHCCESHLSLTCWNPDVFVHWQSSRILSCGGISVNTWHVWSLAAEHNTLELATGQAKHGKHALGAAAVDWAAQRALIFTVSSGSNQISTSYLMSLESGDCLNQIPMRDLELSRPPPHCCAMDWASRCAVVGGILLDLESGKGTHNFAVGNAEASGVDVCWSLQEMLVIQESQMRCQDPRLCTKSRCGILIWARSSRDES